MSTEPLAGALIGHLVGDFILQNDYLARNKRTSAEVCASHCLIWTLCVLLFSGWLSAPAALPIFIFLFVTHFTQDHTSLVARWMDFIGQKDFRTGPCAPWSSIVVDNVWHLIAIWVVWRFVGRSSSSNPVDVLPSPLQW